MEGRGSNKNRTFSIFKKRRSEVEPSPLPRSPKFLVKIPFGASFQSTNSFKNHKNFRKPRSFGARAPLLGAFGPQKWGTRAESAGLTKFFVIAEGICALKRCSEMDFDQIFLIKRGFTHERSDAFGASI